METSRSPADGGQQGLADPRLWDVLLERVLPGIPAASLARLRATCGSMHRLLDDDLSCATWQSAAEQLRNGHCAHHTQQRHRNLSLPSGSQSTSDHLSLQPHEQQQQQRYERAAPSKASSKAFNQVLQLPDEHFGGRPAPLPRESSAAFNHSAHQADKQLQLGLAACMPSADKPSAIDSETLQLSPIIMQQQLRQLGGLLRKLREGGEVKLKPLDAMLKLGPAKWSPCGRWVAQEQIDPSQLIVWDSQTNSTLKLDIMPDGSFLDFSWLPASAWLVYSKVSPLLYRPGQCQDFRKQSIFSHNMASGEQWDLVDRPYRQCNGTHMICHKPTIAPSGHVMAYVHSVCVVLLELPTLKQIGTLFPAKSSRYMHFNVAAMSFNPAGAQLSVCWAMTCRQLSIGSLLEFDNKAFCLDIYNVASATWIFHLPSRSYVNISWAPTSLHLLMSTKESGVLLLSTSKLELVSLPIDATNWFSALYSKTLLWSDRGDLALVHGRSRYLRDRRLCFAIQMDGSIAQQWSSSFFERLAGFFDGHPLPYQQARCYFGDPAVQHALTAKMFRGPDMLPMSNTDSNLAHHESLYYLSRCGCLAVTLPNSLRDPQERIRHADVDASGMVTRLLYIPLPGVQRFSAFTWHPLRALSCVYAVAGRRHDLWLVDGHKHKVLRHWPGSVLLAAQHVPWSAWNSASSAYCSSWSMLSWSADGANLQMRCPCAMLVIDLRHEDSQNPWHLAAKAAKASGFKYFKKS